MAQGGKFQFTVLDIDTIIYKDEVSSIFMPGDKGEFELLSCHYPLLSLLGQGDIIIDWKEVIAINRGIVKFLRNDCVAIIEVAD